MIAWIHPIVVHFAIGVLLIGVLFDAIGLSRRNEKLIFAGYGNTVAGGVSSIAAVATGLVAEAHLGPHSSVGNALLGFHKTFGIVVMIMAVLLAGVRIAMRGYVRPRARTLYLGAAFFTSALLFATGAVGGGLVYLYGLGVPPETAGLVLKAQRPDVSAPSPAPAPPSAAAGPSGAVASP